MNLKPYPKYKDSGIEWLGKIPEGWEVKRLKYSTKSATGFAFSSDDYMNDGVPLIRIGDILESGVVDIENAKKLPVEYAKLYGFAKINNNDVLMAMTGATIGKAGRYLSSGIGLLNQRVCKFVPDSIFPDFLWFILKTSQYAEYIKLTGFGGAQPNISDKQLLDFVAVLPPLPEQQAIATYLDQKTAKIDELIKKNEKLLELLKEKRQAIISHAVTKGLDPNAKMHVPVTEQGKDSGIDWIGEIPEGWGVKKLKYVAEIVLGKMLQNEDSGKDELKPYMRAQNIQWEIVDITDVKEMWFSDYEIKKYRAQKGDLLISEGGEVGRTALWNGELEECYIQNSVHKVTVDKKLANNRYLLNLLKTYGKWGYFESIVNRVSIGHLTREKLKEIKIVCPPKNEQEQIVTYLDKKSSSMDETIQKIQPQIEKLKEYRQALISNVVTGKVRVTG